MPSSTDPTSDTFEAHLAALTAHVAGRPLDSNLQAWLNRSHGLGRSTHIELKATGQAGVAARSLCEREGGDIRYGGIFKPGADPHDFSLDVVDMHDIAGPHHVHSNGEIDLVMPIVGDARFDGRPARWLVFPPGSDHRPTVSEGRARVLDLPPHGQIQFTC